MHLVPPGIESALRAAPPQHGPGSDPGASVRTPDFSSGLAPRRTRPGRARIAAMRIERPSSVFPLAAVVGGWAGLIGSFVVDLAFDLRLRSAGRGELAQFFVPEAAVFLPAILSAAAVGSALILR